MWITITQAHAGTGTSRHKGQNVEVSDEEGQKLVDCGWAMMAVSPIAVALQTLASYKIGIVYPTAGDQDVKKVVAMAEEMGVDAVPGDAPKPKPKPKTKKAE